MTGSSSSYEMTFADAMTKQCWGAGKCEQRFFDLSDTISLLAARNEVVGFQVRVLSEHDFVLVIDGANWQHPLGFRPRLRFDFRVEGLPQEAIEVFLIGYMEGDDRRWWMETLDRAGSVEVSPERPQSIFVRIRTPRAIAAGRYIGTVRFLEQSGFGDEKEIWQGKVSLDVARVQLPDVKDYHFHLNLWQHLTAIARFYHVPLWSDAHLDLIDRYFASLAQLGQKVVSLVVTEMPWSGQRCYRDGAYPSSLYEHSLIQTYRNKDGVLHFDYRVMDRIIALAAGHAMDRQIDVFGLVNIWVDEKWGFGKVAPDAPDAVRVRCYDETSQSFTYLRTAEDIRIFIRSLHDHFAELGLIDRVRVAADEPADLEKFNQSVAFVRQAGPEFQYSAAINHFEFLDDAPQGVIDFIPVLPLACKDPELTAHLTEKLHREGGKMSWYVCCWPPFPNTFLHSPLVEGRLHGWLTHALHLDGFLRWAFCLWPADPWNRVSWRAPEWSAGDMYFVLPGKDGAPVETLRYEAMRAAVQDYELIRVVEQTLPAEAAKTVIDSAFARILRAGSLEEFADPAKVKPVDLYSLDPADYHAARKILFEVLG